MSSDTYNNNLIYIIGGKAHAEKYRLCRDDVRLYVLMDSCSVFSILSEQLFN